MKREQIEKDLRNLQEVISSFQDGLDEIKHQFEKLQDKEEHTYSIGDRFRTRNYEYMLAYCGSGTVGLINLDTGTIWHQPVKASYPYSLTEKQWQEIAGDINLFTKIEK